MPAEAMLAQQREFYNDFTISGNHGGQRSTVEDDSCQHRNNFLHEFVLVTVSSPSFYKLDTKQPRIVVSPALTT